MFCAYGLTKVVSTSFTPELMKMAGSGLVDTIVDDLKDVKSTSTAHSSSFLRLTTVRSTD